MQKLRGFTLVELLVVISIILILASLAFPALNSALLAAQKAQCSALVNSLKTGITAYNTEYSVWPSDTAGQPNLSANNAYPMLIGDPAGVTSNTTYSNARQIVFMQFQNKDLDTGSSATATKFVDPGSSLGYAKTFQLWWMLVIIIL